MNKSLSSPSDALLHQTRERYAQEGERLTLKDSDIDTLREQCFSSLAFFIALLMPNAGQWFDPDFHGKITDFLQYDPHRSKAVITARGHLKTTICSVYYPLWRATKDPNVRILISSNTDDNAAKSVATIMGIVERNQLYSTLFPERIPRFNKTRWSPTCACLQRDEEFPEGTFESAGVGSTLTRRHYNLIIEDDTVSPKKDDTHGDEIMPGRDQIEQAIGFHKLTVPLLISPGSDERLFVCTRWAFYDVLQWIFDHECDPSSPQCFGVLNLPAIVDGKNSYMRFSLPVLEGIRKSMGEFMFSSLYLNAPLDSARLLFRKEWLRYYQSWDDVPKDGEVVITVDPADPPTGKDSQCYSAAVVGRQSRSGLYVLDYYMGRCTDLELMRTILNLAEKWSTSRIRIEKDRYPHLAAGFRVEMQKRQQDAMDKGRTPLFYSIEEVHTRGRAKEARIQRLSPLFENGFVWLKQGMKELETQLLQFPMGKEIDLVDALAWQFLDTYYAPGLTTKPVPTTSSTSYSISWNDLVDTFRPQVDPSCPYRSVITHGNVVGALSRC